MTTIEQFQAMLKRRGYTDSTYYLPSKLLGVKMTYTDGRHSHHAFTSREIDLITAGPAYLIDATLGCGQIHMMHTCGHILLRGDEGEMTRFHVYRDVQAGPQSAWVWECPGCHEELREDEIHEVQD